MRREPRSSRLGHARDDIVIRSGRADGGYVTHIASFSDRPVFLVDNEGRVLFANPPGRKLLDEGSVKARKSLAAAIRSGCTEVPWLLTPLQADDQAMVFLAILQSGAANAPAVDAIEAATAAWKLTPKQRQVLDVVSRGLTNVDTGRLLGITEGTVEYHLARIFDKAGVENRATLIARLLDLSNRGETRSNNRVSA